MLLCVQGYFGAGGYFKKHQQGQLISAAADGLRGGELGTWLMEFMCLGCLTAKSNGRKLELYYFFVVVVIFLHLHLSMYHVETFLFHII